MFPTTIFTGLILVFWIILTPYCVVPQNNSFSGNNTYKRSDEENSNSEEFEGSKSSGNSSTSESGNITTTTTTRRTTRTTRRVPIFTLPTGTPKPKTMRFRDKFAFFYCEKISQCNVIPKIKACGRDWSTGIISYFENRCTLWKTNCMKIGMYFEQDISMCDDLNYTMTELVKNNTLKMITNDQIDRPIMQPYGFNPYYYYNKKKANYFPKVE